MRRCHAPVVAALWVCAISALDMSGMISWLQSRRAAAAPRPATRAPAAAGTTGGTGCCAWRASPRMRPAPPSPRAPPLRVRAQCHERFFLVPALDVSLLHCTVLATLGGAVGVCGLSRESQGAWHAVVAGTRQWEELQHAVWLCGRSLALPAATDLPNVCGCASWLRAHAAIAPHTAPRHVLPSRHR